MFSVKGTRGVVRQLEREKDALMTKIASDVLTVARDKTPIDKGQARRGWRLESAFREKRIVNRVPYIELLEDGRSKQSPNGIIRPTIREINRRTY